MDRLIVVAGISQGLIEATEKESEMKKLLFSLTVLGLTLVGTTVASTAAEVVRTFVDGKYKYTCIESNGGHNCGNWNRAQ